MMKPDMKDIFLVYHIEMKESCGSFGENETFFTVTVALIISSLTNYI